MRHYNVDMTVEHVLYSTNYTGQHPDYPGNGFATYGNAGQVGEFALGFLYYD